MRASVESESKTPGTPNLGMMRRWAACYTLRPLPPTFPLVRTVSGIQSRFGHCNKKAIVAPAFQSEATDFTNSASANSSLSLILLWSERSEHTINWIIFSLSPWETLRYETSTEILSVYSTGQNSYAGHSERNQSLVPASCFAYSSTLKKEVICSAETSVDFQGTTLNYIREDRTLQSLV
jgi:hypothetical protein